MAVRTRERSVRVPTSQPTSAAAVAPRAPTTSWRWFPRRRTTGAAALTHRSRTPRTTPAPPGRGWPRRVDAEFFAACTSRATSGSDMTPSAIWVPARGRGLDLGKSPQLREFRPRDSRPANGARSRSSRSMSSFCARTLTHSPAAIEIAPANRPDTPARRTSEPSVEAPAMPESGRRWRPVRRSPRRPPPERFRPDVAVVVDHLEAVMLIRGACTPPCCHGDRGRRQPARWSTVTARRRVKRCGDTHQTGPVRPVG